jgi:acyl-CoA reductase-like NAD-dependent aldehyde dehydrogenase
MFKFKQLLDAHHDELAELITRDHGKVTFITRGLVLSVLTQQLGGDIIRAQRSG